jgi:hypothetical protein
MSWERWCSAGNAEDCGLDRVPENVREHLIERMHDRRITVEDLNRLRLWIESDPEVPDGMWHKDFGSFKLCGEGQLLKTFLLPGQSAKGMKV